MLSIKVVRVEADLVRQFRGMEYDQKEFIIRLCTRMATESKREMEACLALIANHNKGVK
ncbi:hypothetical protein [Glaciimonas sp. PAMC28666]|uniref:hypothetical protein n=1 Tax=Glaciimonas sp. PAMC28666 TaxID=2807626 RepID=UPI0019638828|nr:hypothetical protein [Glaciimonas sp. PAMC28666]QRX83272.1 hypothetical protein JQN73_03055 [Glaciimonas sp. PAMC28666]